MTEDQRFWIGLVAAVVIAVAAAAMPNAFQSGSTAQILARVVLFIVLGLSCIATLRAIVHPAAGSATKKLLRVIIFGTLGIACAYALWENFRAPLQTAAVPRAPASTPADAMRALATQLSRGEWALNGESCARNGIRFALEDNILAAYPRGYPAIRYRLIRARGHQLTAQLDSKIVIFEIRPDGFTHIEGEHVRWFQLCD